MNSFFRNKGVQKIYADRQKTAAVEPHLLEQFTSGKLLGMYFLLLSTFDLEMM